MTRHGESGSRARVASFAALLILVIACSCFAADSINIELKNGSEAEQQTRSQLKKLLAAYDLSEYTFTRQILIDEHSIPHSHPVLTLHTRHLNSDDQLLSTYIHEQLHWYLIANQKQTDAAEAKLRKLYPKVPVGYPDGAHDEESTYLHLIDCYLEMQADRSLLGQPRAADVIKFWAGDHYRWVYQTIVRDEAQIAAIVRGEHLELGGN